MFMCVCFRLAAVVAVVVVMMTPTAVSPVDKTAVRFLLLLMPACTAIGPLYHIIRQPRTLANQLGGKGKAEREMLALFE